MYSAGKGFLLIAIVTTPTMKFFMESWERKLIVATGNEANELYHVRRRECDKQCSVECMENTSMHDRDKYLNSSYVANVTIQQTKLL